MIKRGGDGPDLGTELTPWWISGPVGAKYVSYVELKNELTLDDLIPLLEIWLVEVERERMAYRIRENT